MSSFLKTSPKSVAFVIWVTQCFHKARLTTIGSSAIGNAFVVIIMVQQNNMNIEAAFKF